MSIAAAVQGYSPAVNPDRVFLKLTFSGNYVAGGDTLNLTPSTWTDPKGIGVLPYPENPPSILPSVYSTDYTSAAGGAGGDAGSYCAVVPGTTLANYKLQQFEAGGSELAAGAYPVGITGGYVFLEVRF